MRVIKIRRHLVNYPKPVPEKLPKNLSPIFNKQFKKEILLKRVRRTGRVPQTVVPTPQHHSRDPGTPPRPLQAWLYASQRGLHLQPIPEPHSECPQTLLHIHGHSRSRRSHHKHGCKLQEPKSTSHREFRLCQEVRHLQQHWPHVVSSLVHQPKLAWP